MLRILLLYGVGKKVDFVVRRKVNFVKHPVECLGINVACTVGSAERIFRALFRPNSDTHFVSVGVKHLKFWSVAGNTLVDKKAIIKSKIDEGRSSKMQTMLSIAFGTVKKILMFSFCLIRFIFPLQEDRTYTGSMTGLVFIWRVNTLERTVVAHTGPIFSIFSSDNCIVTGAKEK